MRRMKAARVFVDVSVLSLAYLAAFLVRFDGLPPSPILKKLVITWPYVVALEYLVLAWLGTPRFSWRFFGLKEATRVTLGLTISGTVLVAFRVVMAEFVTSWHYSRYLLVPLGVLAANVLLAFVGLVGVRALRRLLSERANIGSLRPAAQGARTLLIGAGQAGLAFAKEIERRPDLGLKVVGFIDDDPHKRGEFVNGFRVFGTSAELPDLVESLTVEQAVITIANAPGATIRRIVQACEGLNLKVKVVPGLYELLEGKVSVGRVREVSIEDLLGRETVELDAAGIRQMISGETVLVTGAGGSIGSELCRQIVRFGVRRLVLFEVSEFALFQIHRELAAAHPEVELVARIGSVCDQERLRDVFGAERPSVVFHAAAHKHVPMMEWNPGEAIKNNVFGTITAADVAAECGVEAFVLISTDKAVNPTSVMGASKRVAELYIQAKSSASATRYIAVRFGNVLGSTGSVVPVFKEQIERGGPVTVTHPEMRRYFMTIPEATQLVLQAAAIGESGGILVLDMGEPVRIVDLAQELIRLSGFEVGRDIEIVFSGIRPGEKLFEELGFDAERMDRTQHSKIFSGHLGLVSLDDLRAGLLLLKQSAASGRESAIRSSLRRLVPEMIDPACDPATEEKAPPSGVPRLALSHS